MHRATRPPNWTTIELGDAADLSGALARADSPVLVDCLGTWLTAVIDRVGWEDTDRAKRVVEQERARALQALQARRHPTVLVTNEVGWSLVATTPGGRLFHDELGRLNAAVATVADRVHLVVVGRVLDLSAARVVGDG